MYLVALTPSTVGTAAQPTAVTFTYCCITRFAGASHTCILSTLFGALDEHHADQSAAARTTNQCNCPADRGCNAQALAQPRGGVQVEDIVCEWDTMWEDADQLRALRQSMIWCEPQHHSPDAGRVVMFATLGDSVQHRGAGSSGQTVNTC